MIRVAVVDDDLIIKKKIKSYIRDYEKRSKSKLKVTTFDDAAQLVRGYKPIYDIIFMDIEMEELDGMTAAEEIRKIDKEVIIIFVTNMAGFAIKGYKVDAFSYIVKPIMYVDFAKQLKRAIARIENRRNTFMIVTYNSEMLRVDISKISYMESLEHKVIIHIEDDNLIIYSSLKKLELQVKENYFARCNSCYLVNLNHVERVEKDNVIVAGESLKMSRSRKKAFMNALTEYIGGELE